MDENLPEADSGDSRRAAPRASLFLFAELKTPAGDALGRIRVRNLSAVGLMADCDAELVKGQSVILDLRGLGDVSGHIAWVRDDRIGVAFDSPVDPWLVRNHPKGGHSTMPDYLRPLTDRRY